MLLDKSKAATLFLDGDFKSSSNDAGVGASFVEEHESVFVVGKWVFGTEPKERKVDLEEEEVDPKVGPPKEAEPKDMTCVLLIQTIDFGKIGPRENIRTVLALDAGDS